MSTPTTKALPVLPEPDKREQRYCNKCGYMGCEDDHPKGGTVSGERCYYLAPIVAGPWFTADQMRNYARAALAASAGEGEGPVWEVTNNGRHIYCDRFEHDIRLTVDGDFESDEERIAFAKACASKLATPQPPEPSISGYQPTEGETAREGLIDDFQNFVSFLCGSVAFDGTHFGEKHRSKRGEFWWRTPLCSLMEDVVRALRAAPPPPMGGEPAGEVYELDNGERHIRSTTPKRLPEPGTKLYTSPMGGAAEGWRPIETAPKGERVLVWDAAPNGGCSVAHLLNYPGRPDSWVNPGGHKLRPTHYMPLPAAPQEGSQP
jgi:hypothetical protein